MPTKQGLANSITTATHHIMFSIITVWMNKNMLIVREVYLKTNEHKKVQIVKRL